jgi:hypothetical protein
MTWGEVLTHAEAGRHLRASRWTIHRLITSGALPGTVYGGITASSLAALIQQSATPTTTEEPMPGTGIPHLYTLAEVAEKTGKSLRWLQTGAREQRFRHRKLGKQRLMTQEDIDLLVAQNVVDTTDAPADTGDAEVAAELARRASRGRRPTRKAA